MVQRLRRLGHVEELHREAITVVPTTLCWSPANARGMVLGARDEFLRGALREKLGLAFSVEPATHSSWPETWRVDGERDLIASKLEILGIAIVDEPGMRLLAALPPLEIAISGWGDDSSWSPGDRVEILTDPGRGSWVSADDYFATDALARPVVRGRGPWRIEREERSLKLNTSERRTVAVWAELARQKRPPIRHHRESGRLVLPRCYIPPPVLLERPLIWAAGRPPSLSPTGRGLVYETIDRPRAEAVARILQLHLEDAP